MIRFSANLGFLWKELALPDAIRRAAATGFDAVECHEPYAFDPADVRAALNETGLEMVSLNTFTGDQPGDFGLAALPDRVDEARAAIDQAIAYADAIDCTAVSVVAGRSGRTAESETVYRENLAYAALQAAASSRKILIEPLNTGVAEDYHLVTTAAAIETIEAVAAPNLKLMLDTFHSSTMDGQPLRDVIADAMSHIGHIQISAFPDRGEPDRIQSAWGDINFGELLPATEAMGYARPFGAEYNPRGDSVEAGLSWMAPFR
jgi:hydroxypyruvate isomerase